MCGIAGIIADRPIHPPAIEAMTGLMAHRGPDGHGHWFSDDGRCALGHCRLSVIDTSGGGRQPMGRDGLTIVFNGEIYNYLELRAELERAGETFRSTSDTEVLLAAYARWGRDCLGRLNGMFAFAIHDPARRTLFCARDRYGEKPFLFTRSGGSVFAFASEYKALLALAETGRDIDPERILKFLVLPTQGLDDQRQTVFRSIWQLLPGECMQVSLETLDTTIESYWQPTIQPGPAPAFADAVAEFRSLLQDSLSLRLRSDVPLGSCLSGGLDSGAIVCMARATLGRTSEYHVFTGRFPGTQADEWERASQVVAATGVRAHITEPTLAGFRADLPAFIWANELPVGSTSQYAQYCVFRRAREVGVTVLLDGQGADELLGGYEQYFQAYLASLPPAQRAAEEAKIRARYPLALPAGRAALSSRLPPQLRRRLALLSGRGSDALFGLSAEFARSCGVISTAISADSFDDAPHPLARALRHDSLKAHLPTLLRYGDRNSMAHSREVRLPFCDHRLLEFVLAQPPGHLMGDTQTKRLLREAMRGILPEPIRGKWSKQGFLPPQELWFRDGLIDEVTAIIEDPDFNRCGWWNTGWWRAVLRRFRQGEHHLAWVLWRPFIADAWRRHFIERVAAMPAIPARR